MPCCRCNRTGSCKGCACVKAGNPCTSCLPGKLGSCANRPPLSSCVQPPTVSTLINDPPTSNQPATDASAVSAAATSSEISSFHPNHPDYPDQSTNTECEPNIQLPPPEPVSRPGFTWGNHSAADFVNILEATYAEVVHWRRNIFTVPFGKAGREFVGELSKLYHAFASASALESIALKAATVFPILLLQKPRRASKAKEHAACLERRLRSWNEGNLNDLIQEGRAIQRRIPKLSSSKQTANIARSFADLMFAGKCKAALDLLSNSGEGGLLHLDDHTDQSIPDSPTVREVLIEKHPTGQTAHANCILQSPPQEVHPVVFESIDASVIRSAAMNTTGSAGPSGIDAYGWRRLCTSFKAASSELCHSLASVARRICTSYVDPKSISPLLACRLIALDKKPGVRPIGIGDTARRIIAKAVLSVAKPDIQEASGCLQMCGGQISGIEAAVHAVRTIFNSSDTEAVLLVDATNAFNSLNRQVALQNIRRHCPPLATILINTYRAPTELFVDGDTLLSQEGTTQGDPLAMPMYALATIPLIKKLKCHTKQIWYADDAAAIGKLADLRAWWDHLTREGPDFGYYPNPSKTWLVTKEGCEAAGFSTFAGTGVNVTQDGRPYLGAAVGSTEYVEKFVKSKVSSWLSSVCNLTAIARTQPHAAYSALTHGLSSKWTYLCRTVPNISNLLKPLDDILQTKLIPALTGKSPPSDLECALFALPARMGGLGIAIPSQQADREHLSSLMVTSALQDHIILQNEAYGHEVIAKQLESKAIVRNKNREKSSKAACELTVVLPDSLRRSVELASEKGSSTWLTVLPLSEHGFTLHKGAFHDALALRYGWTPDRLPSNCTCGASFSVEHALSCAKGGFPSIRHNEIRDLTATLLTEVCNDVCIEPELQPVTDEELTGSTANSRTGARLDIAANGVWGGTFERTYFDVSVFNPHAPSNRQTNLQSVYRKHEKIKKRAYEQRIREIEHATFTPLVLSATCGLAMEANTFYKRLASMLASKWDHNYSSTLCWLRCRLAFSLLRSSIQAIRGARSSCGHAIRMSTVVDLINSESRLSSH